MHRETFQVADIIFKFVHGECTDSELEILEQWIRKDPRNKALFDNLVADESISEESDFLDAINMDRAWGKINARANKSKSPIRLWYSIAASILIIVGFSLFYFRSGEVASPKNTASIPTVSNDVAPADAGARLIAPSGKEYLLEDEIILGHNGSVTSKEGKNIIENHVTQSEEETLYNVLEVPKANFFKMNLPDGSVIWINAMSSLRFPVKFGHKERRVYLKGEAYFEVAKDVNRPFIVDVEGKEVRVFGTEFNVRTYNNIFKTTLVEGKVEVSGNGISEYLIPGQYATWNNNRFVVDQADLQKDLAWKNNEFYFKNDNIVQIASQLMMWYDLDVKIASNISTTKTYSGSINRNVNLSEVLTMLKFVSNLDFMLKGKDLRIKNK
ncbi:FecR family protein [Sphingobacterium alkalisoli]|uniref:FecR family protein n=1 Tax=Sphingobacterium alkalisoli TaxID=1874115 RepID=A0A4U0GYN8_9SPHI|nr:FecR family protein [Sphingobacterium alkalisoli]TJY64283.1 FecR family protein [Sphingobacterium alkalisoli]GGH22704.1 iron dicitrate transporter FecR [Sphingobacterium alkalisoli]